MLLSLELIPGISGGGAVSLRGSAIFVTFFGVDKIGRECVEPLDAVRDPLGIRTR